MAEEHADRESVAEDFEARESFSGGGSDDEIQEYRPTFDHFSTRDAMAEEIEHDIDSPRVEDDDEMLSKESKIDDDQQSEETADETVNQPTPRRKTRARARKPSTFHLQPVPQIRRMNQHLPSVAFVASRHFPRIFAVPMNSFHLPRVRARQRSLQLERAGDRLKPADQVHRRRSAAAAQTTTLREPGPLEGP